jgi:hypothetical protein
MAVTPGTKIDCEYVALAAYPGNIQDKELAWLQNNGATSTNLPTAWIQFLAIQLGGAATGDRADDETAYYKSVISGGDQTTYGKSLVDLRRTFWCGGYNPP